MNMLEFSSIFSLRLTRIYKNPKDFLAYITRLQHIKTGN